MSRFIRIKDIADLNRETFKKGSFPEIIKYLDTGSLTKNKIERFQHLNIKLDKIPSRAQRKVQTNTILYSTVRPNQEHFGIIERKFENIVVSTGFTTIDVTDKAVYPKFIFYLLTQQNITEYLHTIGMNSVSSYPSISPDDIGNLKFRIPDLPAQKSIAKVLSDLDAKIELNNKINRELEAMAKTLYDYWFVQFDFPDANGKPYKSSGGKMVFNAELKREIPEGWEVKTISKWIKKDKSGDWGKEEIEGNYQLEVSCIRGADLNGLNGNGELKAPTRFILEKNSNKLLENHDLIVEISGGSPTQSTGRLAFITEETLERFSTPIICSNFCKALTLLDETYLFNFVYQWNTLYDNGILFGWEGKTSGIKNLLFESFVTNHKEVYPPSNLAQKFYDFAKPLHGQIQKNLMQNQNLTALRDWLLPMLMNGQVTVKEAEEKLSMAAEPSVKYGEQ
jgi:hypothetical protein